MSWDTPTPQQIADQASSDIKEEMRPVMLAKGLDPDSLDTESERSVFRVFAIVIGLALYPVYLFFAWVLDQLFVDRCSEFWLAVHARIWNIPRIAAIRAVGTVTLTGSVGLGIPISTRMSLSGSVWRTTAAAVVGAGGTVSVAVEAVTAGVAGNQPAATILSLEVPIVGLTAQTATVDAGGISGGQDIQSVDDWRSAVIAHIRQPPHGGADFDYETWAAAILSPARVKVLPSWIGAGTVGVAFAMPDGLGGFRAPTIDEVAVMQAGLDVVKPVTATVIALAAVPHVYPLEVAVSPYSTQVETAIKVAATSFFKGKDIQIGAKLRKSRLDERLSRAAGEDWHSLVTPTTDLAPSALEFAVLGTITVEEAI